MKAFEDSYYGHRELLIEIQENLKKLSIDLGKKDLEIKKLRNALQDKHAQLSTLKKEMGNSNQVKETTLKTHSETEGHLKFEKALEKKNFEIKNLREQLNNLQLSNSNQSYDKKDDVLNRLKSENLLSESEERDLSYILLKNFEAKYLSNESIKELLFTGVYSIGDDFGGLARVIANISGLIKVSFFKKEK